MRGCPRIAALPRLHPGYDGERASLRWRLRHRPPTSDAYGHFRLADREAACSGPVNIARLDWLALRSASNFTFLLFLV